eukprot:Tamp_00890.p3 GENE.Tamp_00890~~Tamp_00890.p3  ORF type:complete len:277 (-),score=71.23 Tamp_00890:2144-2974(-)
MLEMADVSIVSFIVFDLLRRRPAAAGVSAAAKKKQPAVAFKGFGAVPPKLESRVPESDDEPCECQSGLAYGQCCKPFHAGEKWPETPLQLMRSRYTGYAYRLPDWIIDTTHRSNSDWKSARNKWFNELLGFCDGFNFNGLDIVEDKAGDEGEHYIEFVARMTARETAPTDAPKDIKQTLRRVKYQAGTDKVAADFRERSKFVLEDGKWMYQGGDVDFDPKATLIMEDGVRLEAPEPKPDAQKDEKTAELIEQLDDIQAKPDHPAFKKTGGRTFKAN